MNIHVLADAFNYLRERISTMLDPEQQYDPGQDPWVFENPDAQEHLPCTQQPTAANRVNRGIEGYSTKTGSFPALNRMWASNWIGRLRNPKPETDDDVLSEHDWRVPFSNVDPLCMGIVSPMAILGDGELTSFKHVAQLYVHKFYTQTIKGNRRRWRVHYHVLNRWGQLLLTARERSNCFGTMLCGQHRHRELVFRDNAGVEVLHMDRPFRCCLCCGIPACLDLEEQEIILYSQGRLLGCVRHSGYYVPESIFDIRRDLGGVVTHTIIGLPCGGATCCEDGYDVFKTGVPGDNESKLVGYVKKSWDDAVPPTYQGYYTDHFGLGFEPKLNTDVKMLLLGGAFLIHFLIYENDGTLAACTPCRHGQHNKYETLV